MIHETAVVDDINIISDCTNVWHFTHICSGAKIGKKCNFGQNVFVSSNVVIGDNVKVQNNVSIYDNITIEDNVFCGPSMVFTNVINPRCEFPRKTEYKKTLVKKGASIGANATIVCGNIIGQYCFIGAGCVVTNDVKDFALVVGVPSKQIGWVSRFGEKIDLPVDGDGFEFKCQHTGDIYNLVNGVLKLTSFNQK